MGEVKAWIPWTPSSVTSRPGAHMAHYHTFLLFGNEVMVSRSLPHIAYGVMVMKYLNRFRKKVTKRELKERKKKDGLFFFILKSVLNQLSPDISCPICSFLLSP